MPYKKYKKKRRKKITDGGVMSLSRGPFPSSYITRHKYVQTFTMAPGAGGAATYLFNTNGMWKPNTTVPSLSHQPLGFDQLTPIYDHYTVLGSKIKVNFASGGAAVSDNALVGVYVNDDASPVTTYNTVMEQGGATSKILSGLNAKGVATITKGWSAKRYFGVTDVVDNEKYKGSNLANPIDGAYFVIFAQGLAAATAPAQIFVEVEIDYTAQWSEPRSLAQSVV